MIRSSLSTSHSFTYIHPATPAIYTLSLHDALPISGWQGDRSGRTRLAPWAHPRLRTVEERQVDDAGDGCRTDRKSTRLNSSHSSISYAVFCLKKKIRMICGVTTRRASDSGPTCDID